LIALRRNACGYGKEAGPALVVSDRVLVRVSGTEVSREKQLLIWGLASAVPTALLGVAINVATDRNDVIAWTAVGLATALVALANVVLAVQFAGLASSARQRIGVAAALFSIGVVALVWVILSTEPVGGDPRTDGRSGKVIREVDSYSLVSADEPSLSNFCPKDDKLDLDSGQPGHGGQAQLGDYVERCRTEGGLAELILERSELHTPDNSRLYKVMRDASTASFDDCNKALGNPAELRARLSLAELSAGAGVCVQTDEGNIALMRVHRIGKAGTESEVVISFVTWNM
jgi:hypothetical protein